MLVFAYLGLYHRMIEAMIPGPISQNNIMMHIALAHTVFNFLNTAVFLVFLDWLKSLVQRIVKTKPGFISTEPEYLDRLLIETPVLALEQSKKEILRMLRLARSALKDSFEIFFNEKWDLERKLVRKEEAVDNLQAEITRYLIDISMEELDERDAEMIPVFIHSVNDIERIADNAENIMELAQRKYQQKLPFTDDAVAELNRMIDVSLSMIENVIDGLANGDTTHAARALKGEEKLNNFQIEFRLNHVRRLEAGGCNMLSGLVFLDFVDYLEKIGDHLANIAQGLMGGLRWDSPKQPQDGRKGEKWDSKTHSSS